MPKRVISTPKYNTAAPRVTVITIFFNAGEFLKEAIESVVSQTFTDWEFLLVDDGSSDVSSRIAKEYAARNPDRVRYLTHPGSANRGMSASRNLGLNAARGEFVCFLDADDVWVPRKLEEQVALLDAHPEADMVCGATVQWMSWAGGSKDKDTSYVAGDMNMKPAEPRPRRLPFNQPIEPPACMIEIYPLGEGSAPSMSNLIMRSHLPRQVGGFEENFRGMYEDQVFLAKVYLFGKILFSDRAWDYYRQHENSCMASTSFELSYQARESYLRWLDAYLQSHPVKDPRANAAVKEKLHKAWQHWHSTSFKRRIIRTTEKFLPSSLTLRAYAIWSKLRRSLSAVRSLKV